MEDNSNEPAARWRGLRRDARFGHFLLELLLLVVGILIALAVNGWIEDRRDARTERQYLERLVRDFDQDLTLLAEFIAFETRQTNDAVLGYRSVCNGLDTADRENVVGALDRLTMRRTVRLARATYADLLATGNLRLISDAALRDRIVKLYEGNDRWTMIVDRNNQVYVDQMYTSFLTESGLVVPRAGSNLPSSAASRQQFMSRLGAPVRARVDRLWTLAPDSHDLNALCGKLWYRGFVSMQAIDQARAVVNQITTVRDEIATAAGQAHSE